MEQSNQSKKVLLSVIGVAILVVAVVGVSFAFFNYTRTGGTNTVTTGHIEFTTSQTYLDATNLFPITTAAADQDNGSYTDEAVVSISGYTTYTGGIDYKVYVSNFHNTIAATGEIPVKSLPLSVRVSSANIPATGMSVTTYNYDQIADGKLLASGTISENVNVGTNNAAAAQIIVKAFLNADLISISDTVAGPEGSETTSEWVRGRTNLTTAQWNAISASGNDVSFKITVEAVQHNANFLSNTNSTAAVS